MDESKQILEICMKKAIELLNNLEILNQITCNNNLDNYDNYDNNGKIKNIEKEIEFIRKIMETTQNYITYLS
jgi:hypothetical protein